MSSTFFFAWTMSDLELDDCAKRLKRSYAGQPLAPLMLARELYDSMESLGPLRLESIRYYDTTKGFMFAVGYDNTELSDIDPDQVEFGTETFGQPPRLFLEDPNIVESYNSHMYVNWKEDDTPDVCLIRIHLQETNDAMYCWD